MRIGCGGNEVYPKWLGRHATNGLDLLAFQAGRFENHAEESVIAALMTAVTSSDRATPPIPAKTDGGADIQVGRRLLFAELLARPVTFKFIAWGKGRQCTAFPSNCTSERTLDAACLLFDGDPL